MALRTIRIQGDPVLTKKCREITEITPKIKELADYVTSDMFHYGIRDGLKYLKLI